MRRAALGAVVTLVALQSPGLARAAGQPTLGYAAPGQSVRSGDGTHRYLASPHGSTTMVQSIAADGILAHAIPGRFMVPMVALDGSLGGLSGDGRTLVLTRPRSNFPEASTQLAVRSEEHTSELQSRQYLVCRLLL